jgi:hypothetical protein
MDCAAGDDEACWIGNGTLSELASSVKAIGAGSTGAGSEIISITSGSASGCESSEETPLLNPGVFSESNL